MVVSENNMAASISHRAKYVGETKKLLRDGFGVYTYENQFFKYEGEWRNGRKHGRGKLVMKDGTFYEGQFANGEIQGHGYKYFATSGSKYTGHFERGELHGYGIMQYPDGTMFEGEWAHNRKQGRKCILVPQGRLIFNRFETSTGFGVLKTSDNCAYEGEFVGSMKHGEGIMLYENGDRYDGNWVMDKRQGHGQLLCRDGTRYEGQWLNDMFHGEGKMNHASGIIYKGPWCNGYPVEMATKLAIILEADPLELRQGQRFSVIVECRNDGDELVKDQGRELQVSAGFKFYPTKEGSALFDMIEDVEEKPIETPFGYSIVTYPLTDQLNLEFGKEGEGETADVKTVAEETVGKGEEEAESQEQEDEKEDKEEKEGQKEGEGEGSRPSSPTQGTATDLGTDAVTEPTPAESTPLPPPLTNQRTEDGVCEWACLQLAPPPPMYRPFLAMEEEVSLKKSKSKKLAPSKDKSLEKIAKKEVKEKTSTESVIDEKYARPGEYVIMVQDMAAPSFFRGPLPPAFALIKVIKPKPKKKEPKTNSPEKEVKERERWDTQKHIANAMMRQADA